MLRYSANLGFLWQELPLPQAIRAAAAAGFDAVECHWSYETDAATVRAVLEEAGLAMVSLNTIRGGDDRFGLAAVAECEAEARATIDQAVRYAAGIGAQFVHVMAGIAEGQAAREVFASNLHHACKRGSEAGVGILIEPINGFDIPGYFLDSFELARDVVREIGHPVLSLLFDCYHAGRLGHDVPELLAEFLPVTGRIQVAAVPDRGPPDHGMVSWDAVFDVLETAGWTGVIGAEYRPDGKTEDSLHWLRAVRKR